MLALHLFVLACVVTCLPSAVAVAMQRYVSQAASAERDRLHSLVGSTRGIAIIGVDAGGLINLFNPGAEQQLGYRAEEVLGKSTAMFHRQEEFDRLAALLGTEPTHRAVAHVLREPEHAGTEVEFVTKDGDLRVHSMTLARIIDDDGNITGHVSTAEDVTERLRAHSALTEALDAEREAVDRLRQVDQLKDIFVSSVSHELRTPITSILGYLEILEDGGFGELNSSQTNALARVAGNSERLLSLIDDLLLLSQVAGRLPGDEVGRLRPRRRRTRCRERRRAGLRDHGQGVRHRRAVDADAVHRRPRPAGARGHQRLEQRREVHQPRRSRSTSRCAVTPTRRSSRCATPGWASR